MQGKRFVFFLNFDIFVVPLIPLFRISGDVFFGLFSNSLLTLSVPRGVLRSHGSIRHPWDFRSLRRPPKGDFSVRMHF